MHTVQDIRAYQLLILLASNSLPEHMFQNIKSQNSLILFIKSSQHKNFTNSHPHNIGLQLVQSLIPDHTVDKLAKSFDIMREVAFINFLYCCGYQLLHIMDVEVWSCINECA